MPSISAAASAPGVPAPRAAALPWYVPAVLVAATCAVVGVIWDISWHRTIGRDTFWTPAHLAIYASGIIAGLSCGWLVLKTTFAGSDAERAASVRFWGFRGPLGAWLCIWGAMAMIVSAPFDNWWHNAYGLDVKVLSPPHLILALGFTGIQLGAVLMVAALQNRAGGEARRGYGRLLAYGIGILVLNVAIMGFEQIGFSQNAHNALYYLVCAAVFPILLVAGARASSLRWPATTAAAVYVGVTLIMVWVLPLVVFAEARAHWRRCRLAAVRPSLIGRAPICHRLGAPPPGATWTRPVRPSGPRGRVFSSRPRSPGVGSGSLSECP